MAVVGNGFQPFRRGALRQAQGDLPLPLPAGDMSDEDVGRGPRARRFSFRTVRGTVPTTEQSLQRKHVMAVVGNGFQPFRRADEQPPPAPSRGGHEQRGCCRERFPTVPEGGRATSNE